MQCGKRGPYKTALIAELHRQLRRAAVDEAATRLRHRKLSSTAAPQLGFAADGTAAVPHDVLIYDPGKRCYANHDIAEYNECIYGTYDRKGSW